MGRIDNIIKRLADIYDTRVSSNIYKLLSLDATQHDEINDMFEDVRDSHFVEDATGVSLDAIALFVGLIRETSETDEQLRARTLARFQGFIGGGTKDSIIAAVSEFLDVVSSAVTVTDGYLDAGDYGHFRVNIDIGTSWGILQGYDKLVNLINDVKAAGIMFDGIGPVVVETISMLDDFYQTAGAFVIPDTVSMSDDSDLNIHRTDITSTDSINVVL